METYQYKLKSCYLSELIEEDTFKKAKIEIHKALKNPD